MRDEYKEIIGRAGVIFFLAGLLHLSEWYQNSVYQMVLDIWTFYFGVLIILICYWAVLPILNQKRK